jgi:hypothetical protein
MRSYFSIKKTKCLRIKFVKLYSKTYFHNLEKELGFVLSWQINLSLIKLNNESFIVHLENKGFIFNSIMN